MKLGSAIWGAMRAFFCICFTVCLAACGGDVVGGSLVTTTVEDPGANCEYGGTRLDVGIDANGDGELSAEETQSSTYVCSGADGTQGLQSLIAVTPEPAGSNCANGGQRVEYGIDDSGDGVLDPSEVDGATYVCAGVDGTQGLQSLIAVTPEPAGSNCANGGQRVEYGIDDSGDGVLDAAEVDGISYVCNGCADADGDGVCNEDDSCPRDVRVALWFPADGASPDVSNLQADLLSHPSVDSVDILTDTALPMLADLVDNYDAIILGSNWGFGALDADAVGTLAADYVDSGGLVVDGMFNHTTWSDPSTQEWLGGRWETDGYNGLVNGAQINASLADVTMTVTEATDPLMIGFDPAAFVADLAAGTFYLADAPVNTASSLGYVELTAIQYQAATYPGIVVSTDPSRRVLALNLSPIFNLNAVNADVTSRDFLACSISQLSMP